MSERTFSEIDRAKEKWSARWFKLWKYGTAGECVIYFLDEKNHYSSI